MREFNIVASHKIAIQKSIFINKLENIMVKKKVPVSIASKTIVYLFDLTRNIQDHYEARYNFLFPNINKDLNV